MVVEGGDDSLGVCVALTNNGALVGAVRRLVVVDVPFDSRNTPYRASSLDSCRDIRLCRGGPFSKVS